MKRLGKNNVINIDSIWVNANILYRVVENVEGGEIGSSDPLEIWTSGNGEDVLILGYETPVSSILQSKSDLPCRYIKNNKENEDSVWYFTR